MARTKEQIRKSVKDSARQSNSALDTEKGPFFDWVVTPMAEVLPGTEEAAERLSKVYSTDFAKVATEEEALAFLTNWGESAGTGSAAGSVVYFMKYSRPSNDEIISIKKGNIVSNIDGSLQYIVLETKSINGVNADAYYNAQRKTYEIGVRVAAVANGSGYELPAGRINRMVTQVPGIDAIENRVRAQGGDEAENTVTQIERVQEKFKGLAINTPDGGIHRVRRYNTADILDVVPVTCSNRKIFKRISYKPATDYYILGENLQDVTQVYVSTSGNESMIPLQYLPVYSVNSVQINGVGITNFYLSKDTSLELGHSAKADDRLYLDTPLVLGDVVTINLTYNKLINDVQVGVFSETKLFETDELAREFRKVPPIISLVAKALPNYEPTQVASDIASVLEELITPTGWIEEILPRTILDKLQERVAGISKPNFITFKRSTQATSEVEMLYFDKNEVPVYDTSLVTISIRST